MLKGGIIGFGRMGVTHYGLLNSHPNVELKAVCDSSRFVLRNLSRFSKVEVFDTVEKLLKRTSLDFVVVATPTASHAPIIEAALDRGLHVFVEKPLSLGLDSGTQLVVRVRHTSLVNQVGYFLRFNPTFEMARRYIQNGLIGKLIHFRSEMYGRTVMRPSRHSWRSKKSQGGGCMLDFASHCIDQAIHFFGPPSHVSGSIVKSIFSKNVEDAVYTTLTYSDGLSGHILVNWSDETFRRPYNRIEIFGTQGKIIADRQECRLYLRTSPSMDGFRKGWQTVYLPSCHRQVRFDIRGSEFTEQLDHFVDCILGQCERNVCTFADALETDRVIQQVELDAQERGA